MRNLLLGVILLLFLSCGSPARSGSVTLRNGDLVFQQSRSAQSSAIAAATGSRYTHVGMLFYDARGRPMVLEAAGKVRVTPYKAFVKRGADGHVVVKRLRAPLSDQAVADMVRIGLAWKGRPYDPRFRWDDERLYCSELVYKLYERGAGIRLVQPRELRDYALMNPVVQRLIAKRLGRTPTLHDDPVVDPGSLFDADTLVTVLDE